MSKNQLLLGLSPLQKTAVSLAVAAAIFFSIRNADFTPLLKAVLLWIGFSFTFLLLSWIVVFKREVSEIRKVARKDDGAAAFVFLMITLGAFASMFAVFFLLAAGGKNGPDKALWVPAALVGMVLSWSLVHTQYLFHYAHEYYDEDDNGNEAQVGGLDFPDDEEPDYLHFAYYSFCMGCTFQVSDVSTTSKTLRRITFVHGLLAFFLNTFVVALTINLVAGISG